MIPDRPTPRPTDPAPADATSQVQVAVVGRSLDRFTQRYAREPGSGRDAEADGAQPWREERDDDDADDDALASAQAMPSTGMTQQAIQLAQTQQAMLIAQAAPERAAHVPVRAARDDAGAAGALRPTSTMAAAHGTQPARAARSGDARREDERASTARNDDSRKREDESPALPAMPAISGSPQIFHGVGSPQRQATDDDRHKRKGALAQLIEELVDCLQMSEDALPGDWDIRLRLKEKVFPQTDLHMQRQGGRMTLAFRSGDDATLALLAADADVVRERLSALSAHGVEVVVLSR